MRHRFHLPMHPPGSEQEPLQEIRVLLAANEVLQPQSAGAAATCSNVLALESPSQTVRRSFSLCQSARSVPTNPIRSPRLTWSETSSKSARPAKDFESCETVSIAESAQCSLVRCLAQHLNHQSTRMNTNRRCSGGCVSRKSLNLATSCHADSSRGEFGFRAGRSAESPRVCSGGKRENPCRL
jgi:hypothetical protein